MNGTTQLYSVYDTVAESFGLLFQQPNHGSAIRMMRKQFENDQDKDDYLLVHIGQFDQKSGRGFIDDELYDSNGNWKNVIIWQKPKEDKDL